jgi:uncharacterized protein
MSKHVTEPALAVSVRELLQKPGAHKHVVLRAPLADLATPVASVPSESPVTVDCEVESVVEGLLVTGRVGTTAVLHCVRCLRQVDQDLQVDVRELFAIDPREDQDEGYSVLADDRLPLDTMARDALVLAFPAFPLCRPDCAGLCPECGADRNADGFARHQNSGIPNGDPAADLGDARTRLGDCGHDGTGATDPRWAALAGLRQRPQSNEEEDDARPQA